MREHAVEWGRDLVQIQLLDQEPCVTDLPAAAAPHEPAELLLRWTSAPLGLLLQGAEGAEVTVRLDDTQD